MPIPSTRPVFRTFWMDGVHGPDHVGMLHVGQPAHGTGQIVGAQDDPAEARDSENFVNVLDRLDVLDLHQHNHRLVGRPAKLLSHHPVRSC